MAYIPDQTANTGSFIQTTQVWDIGALYDVQVSSPEFKDLLVRLYQQVNNVALAVNLKDTGYYMTQEFVNGQQYFSTTNNPNTLRSVFRLVVNTGALGPGVNTTAHGLTIGATWSFTRIYGTATDIAGGNFFPLPWASAAGATNIELAVGNANIVITNNSGLTFATSYVVLEYIKS